MANTVSRPVADILLEYTQTKAAIAAILTGAQSGSIASGAGSTSFTAADYQKLTARLKDLWDEYSQALDEQNFGDTGLSNMVFRRIL